MFKILRPGGRPDERKKDETGAGAPQGRAEAPTPRVEPPRIELPRRRAAPVPPDQAAPSRPSHLRFVDPARVPSRAPAAPASRPAAPQVAQPIRPAQPARPVIPPYPVPGARAKADKPMASAPGAEVQSLQSGRDQAHTLGLTDFRQGLRGPTRSPPAESGPRPPRHQ